MKQAIHALVIAAALFAACADDAKPVIPVANITVAEAADGNLALKELQTLQLTATALPLDATYRRVLFESSDDQVFTVLQTGVLAGVGRGTATLRVFAADGSGVSIDIAVDVDYKASVTNVRTPGTLASLTANLATAQLEVAGTLNADDIAALAALASAKALTSIDLSLVSSIPGNTLKAASGSLFENAGSLATFVAPLTITAVGDRCFDGAPALATVKLPASTASIGARAFAGVTTLASLVLDAATPPTLADDAFEGVALADVNLAVPAAAFDAYRAADVWKKMTINGAAPAAEVYDIPAAAGDGQWITIPLAEPLLLSDSWKIEAVSTHSTYNPSTFTGKTFNTWGCHLFNIEYTGTVNAGFISGNGIPFEFYFGGPSQGGTKIGAIGRGNWNSTTHTLPSPQVTLNTPVTITLSSDGSGGVACTVHNIGVNGGAPVDFKTITGPTSVTAVKAALPVPTKVTVTRR
ncbi:MAG: Ig-like domain-containing protein [Odoribacteraceae bacterium]|jgi:hypothetical protein|nr:Ig-like domain-containing protein [Odoribacteraceae bacterium]